MNIIIIIITIMVEANAKTGGQDVKVDDTLPEKENNCKNIYDTLSLILPELVADVFKHRNRIPRACRDILRHDSFIHTHCLREPDTYHAIRVVRVNLAKRAVGNRLVLRIMLVVQEELDDLA